MRFREQSKAVIEENEEDTDQHVYEMKKMTNSSRTRSKIQKNALKENLEK